MSVRKYLFFIWRRKACTQYHKQSVDLFQPCELKRNDGQNQAYSAIEAQEKDQQRRKKCKRTKLLENTEWKNIVVRLFLKHQWFWTLGSGYRDRKNRLCVPCNHYRPVQSLSVGRKSCQKIFGTCGR